MGKSCSINGFVQNKEGQTVVSKLWTDLMNFSGNNRVVSKKYWKLFHKDGYGEKQLTEALKDRAKFDENGELTFGTLHQYADMTELDEKPFSKALLEEVPKEPKSFDAAMAYINDFRQNSQFSGEFMPVFTIDEHGKCLLSVAPKNEANEEALNEEVRKLCVRDRITYYLNKAGVAADFIDAGDSRYSTEGNIDQAADGLYHLITIGNGSVKSVDEDYAEEAGHFVFAALGKHPLTQRLYKLLKNDDVRKEIIKKIDPEGNKELGIQEERELAGVLIGKALLHQLNHPTLWARIANRIANLAKKIFYDVKGDEVKQSLLEANQLASQIAQGFISPHFTGTVQNALKVKETRYSAFFVEKQLFNDVFQRLAACAKALRPLNYKRAKALEDVMKNLKALNATQKAEINMITEELNRQQCMEGIAEGMVTALQELTSLQGELSKIDMKYFETKSQEYARTIREAITLVNTLSQLYKDVSSHVYFVEQSKVGIPYEQLRQIRIVTKDGIEQVNLLKVLESINNYLFGGGGLVSQVSALESSFALKSSEDILGANHIKRGQRLVLRKVNKALALVKEGSTVETVYDIINELPQDMGYLSTYFLSASVAPDIMVQIFNKAIQQGHRLKTLEANGDIDHLRKLFLQLQEATGSRDTSWCYETVTDENGKQKLTGNLKMIVMFTENNKNQYETCLNYGAWERDWEEKKQQVLKDFDESPDRIKNRSTEPPAVRALMRTEVLREARKKWDRTHTTIVTEEVNGKTKETRRPNKLYIDQEAYDGMTPVQRKWLKEFMAFKSSVDSQRLGGHHALIQRAPQFKSSTIEAISEHGLKGTLWAQRAKELWLQDANDTDFGSEEISIEEDMYKTSVPKQMMLGVKSVPIYGIRKMENMDNLSTDLFHTMAMYVDMACTYHANSTIVDFLEIMKTYMEGHRRVEGKKDYKESNSFKLLNHIMDVNLYGRVYGDEGVKHKHLIKLIGYFTGLAVEQVLRWNLKGGIVNTGTGIIELLKEACTGEDFTVENLTKAYKEYISEMVKSGFFGFFQDMAQLGKKTQDAHFGNTKLALLIRYFDMLGENEKIDRNWFTSNVGNVHNFMQFYKKLAHSPYGTGEHLMQTISFLAVFENHKLWKYNSETGKLEETKLQDLYEVDDNEGYKYLYRKDEPCLKNPNDLPAYRRYMALLDKYNQAIESEGQSVLNFTDEEIKWLTEQGFNALGSPVEQLSGILLKERERILFTEVDEVDLINKCRRKANDMHGLYDLSNKSYIQTCFLSPALLTMKGYCFGYLQKKAAPAHYNIIQGREDEGTWQTLLKFALGTTFLPIYEHNLAYRKDAGGNIIKDKNGNPVVDEQRTWNQVSIGLLTNALQKLQVFIGVRNHTQFHLGNGKTRVMKAASLIPGAGLLAKNKKLAQEMQDVYGMSDHQIYNLQRWALDNLVGSVLLAVRVGLAYVVGAKVKSTLATVIPLFLFKILLSMFNLLAPGEDDDPLEEALDDESVDEASKKMLKWMYYFIGRLETEQNSYNLTSMDQILQEYKGITSTTPLFVSVLGGTAANMWDFFRTPKEVTNEETGETFKTEEVLKDSSEFGYSLASKNSPYGESVWEQLKPYYKKVITEDEWGMKNYQYMHKPSRALLKMTIYRNIQDINDDPVDLLDGYFWGREHGN